MKKKECRRLLESTYIYVLDIYHANNETWSHLKL